MNTLIKVQLEYHELAYQSETGISGTCLSKGNWNIMNTLIKGQLEYHEPAYQSAT
jgi:hypothetical protein